MNMLLGAHRFTISISTLTILLMLTACSSGELGRSEAKKKLSKTPDMCNPCFIEVTPSDPLWAKLFQLGYVDPGILQLTSSGQKELGESALWQTPKGTRGVIVVGAFKKEVDEVTGIATNPQGLAEVKFTYRIVPILNPVRNSELGLQTLVKKGIYDLTTLGGTADQEDGKLISLHIPGKARFKKYDDGWRVERTNMFNQKLDLDIWNIGGLPESALHR
jgi:hypothetical protein